MKNKKQNIILLSIILLIILFSSWAFIQWIFGLRQYYGTVAVSSSEFQSIHSWMPLVRSIIQGNFFPSEVSVNPEAKALLYYPYLSLWFYGLSIKLLGVVGTMIIGQVLFPVLSFFLLVKIFNRYLDILWSITISLIGLLAFSGWDFKSFLFGLINGNSFIELGVLQPLEIAHFPIPSLSIFLFLLLFYFSTLRVKLNVVNLSVLTSLWALHTQVHAVDALFGLVFWFTYFPIRLYRQTEGKINKKLLLKITMQFVIALIVVFPIIYAIVTQPPSMLGIGIISTDSKTTLDLYYYLAYFILPIMLIISIYIIKRVDVYEIIFKFWHIYMLMLIEIILISFGLLFSKWIVIDMVQNRIALFFLHFYYYVPIVYYATQPAANGLSFGIEAKSISKKINNYLLFIFNRLNKIYLPIIILLLLLFASTSAYKNYQYQKNYEARALAEVWDELELLGTYLPVDGVIVSDTPATNLLAEIVIDRRNTSLWVNRFANKISSDKIIDRLILYAHIYNWPLNKFINFMSPGSLQEGLEEIVDLSNENIYKSGIGFWLVHHKRKLDDSTLNKYLQTISNRYNNMNIDKLISEFSVTHIYSVSPISKDINIKYVQELNSGVLYHVGINQDD